MNGLNEFISLLPALLIITIPLILHLRALKKRKLMQQAVKETEEKGQAKAAGNEGRLMQPAGPKPALPARSSGGRPVVLPISEILAYRRAGQFEGKTVKYRVPDAVRRTVADQAERSGVAEDIARGPRRKIVRRLEAFPPLKRAVIWAEILGLPRGWSQAEGLPRE